jgi:hypothetical protein
MKFVRDFMQVGGFRRFPPPIKLTNVLLGLVFDRSLQGKVSVPPLHLFVAIKVITWKCSLIAVLPLNVHDILFVDFFPSM